MEEIGLEKARQSLGEIVDKARLAGMPTLVTRQNKPAAVIVSYDWYRRTGDVSRFPLDMAQIKCPDCEAGAYPDDMAEAVAWAMGHKCDAKENEQ